MAISERCEIGFPPTFVDYGPDGLNFLQQDYKYEETAENGIGIGTLNLESTWGTDANIVEKMVIRHYLWDTSTLRVVGWLFYGVLEIPSTSRVPGTGQKTWALQARSWNIALTTVVGEAAWAPGVHVPAGDFATQINFVAQGLCGGSSVGIDSVSYVANLYTGTLPAQVITGKNLLNALGLIFAQARALNPLLFPACFISPDPAVPNVMGPPVLQVYDLAVALARAPTHRYSDVPADILSGARLPILAGTPPDRQRDATTLLQRQQSVTPAGLVYTSENAASIAAYPHPLAANHAWSAEAVADTSNHGASANASGTAVLSGGAVASVTMGLNGNGYPGPPLVRFTPVSGGSGAVGVAVMGGHLLSVTPGAGGSGYTTATTVGTVGGGGTGAVIIPVISAGVITGFTVPNGGTGFTSVPGFIITDPGGGTGATATGAIGGQVLSVTMLAGGSGYGAPPLVAFVDAVQAVLDATVAQTAEPVESPRVLVKDKPNAGDNISITLALEAGITDVTYRVVKVAGDYSVPGYPVYALDLNRRRRTQGEPPDVVIPVAPIEGVLPSPPSNFVYSDSYNWSTDRADQVFSWTPPPVPNGTSSYDVVVLVVATGLTYHHYVDGVNANILRISSNPGEHQIAYVVGRNGQGVPSVPTGTIDFTTAAATVPNPPTLALDTGTYPPDGWGWNEHGAYAGFLLTPGAGYPADHFEFETWETATPAVKTLHDPIPGTAAAFIWEGFTAAVAYSYHIRGVNLHGTPGAYGSTGTLTVPANVPTAPGSVAQTNSFNPASGETDVALTWTASTPGVGRTLRAYDATFTRDGETYVYEYGPASLGGTFSVPPGSVISGLIVQAKDDLYAYGPASSPALNFTATSFLAPDPPTSLGVTQRGIDSGGQGWAIVAFTPPGTTHGPHDRYQVRIVGGGHKRLVLYDGTGGVTSVLLRALTVGVTYTVDMQTVSLPAWLGAYSSAVSVLIPLGPPDGIGTAGDAPLGDWTATGAGTLTLDATHGYKTPTAFAFAPAVSSTLTLAHGAQPAAPGQVWGMDAWYEKDSGAAPALSVTWAWYDGPNGTGTLLSTDTDTLATPTTSWQEAAMQHKAPTGAASLLVSVVVSLSTTLGVLWMAIPVPPAPAATSPQLAPTGLVFYHPTTGAALSTITIDGTTGAATFGGKDPTAGTDTPLVGTTQNGTAVTGFATGSGGGVVGDTQGGGTAVTGHAHGSGGAVHGTTDGGGTAVLGDSAGGYSAEFGSNSALNTAPTVYIYRQGTSTADLLLIDDPATAPLFKVTSAGVVQPAGYNAADGSAGLSVTIVLAKITPGGTNGSIVIKNGIVTAYTAPT